MSLLFWLWHGVGVPAPPEGAVGLAQGSSTATGVGRALGTVSAVGVASGTGSAAAVGRSTASAVGVSAGVGVAAGVGLRSTNDGLSRVDLQFTIGPGGFSGTGFNPAAFGGSTWISVTPDTRAEDPIVLDYGVQGNGPSDRVAGTGTLTFTLNNAADNSAGIPSWYSPLHAMRRSGHDLNVQVRLVLTINGQVYHKFFGRLAEINPEPGLNGTFRVPCTAVDLMDDWAANDLPVVMPVATGVNAGLLFGAIFNALGEHAPDLLPQTQSIETGIETIPYAFHDPTRRKIRELIIDTTMSEFGFAAMRGGPDSAGNFVFYNRHAATTYPSRTSLVNQFSLGDGFQASLSRDDLATSIEVFVYPAFEDTALIDIFKLEGSPLLVLPSQTVTLRLPFKTVVRPDTPVAALELVRLLPHVDYEANTLESGDGTDLTDNFTVEHVYGGGGFEAVLLVTNLGPPSVDVLALDPSGAVIQPVAISHPPGFITLLKGRGRGLYITEASARVDLDTKYGRRPLEVVMPMQANVNTAADIAHFYGNIYRNTYGQVDAVRFCASKTDTLMTWAIYVEPGDFVDIQEDVTGIAGTFRVQGVRLEIANGLVWCTWRLASQVRQKFWLLGTTDFSELGMTTILGF